MKKILNDIGFQYDDSIFDNSKYTNVIINNVKLVDNKPWNSNHEFYRTWQINQPFISNNDISKIDLNQVQKEEIVNNPYVLQIYPENKIEHNVMYKNKKLDVNSIKKHNLLRKISMHFN